VGDRVLYPKYSGTELRVDGTDHLIIDASDLLAVIGGAASPEAGPLGLGSRGTVQSRGTPSAPGEPGCSELEARTDAVGYERVAEPGADGVLGPPAGAVGGDDDAGSESA